MNLPEQERYTPDEVAARWGKPVSYVHDLNRRGLLIPTRFSIGMWPTRFELMQGKQPKMTFYYMREDLEKFEREHAVAPPSPPRGISIKEYMSKYDVSYRTVTRKIEKEELSAKMLHGRWMIFE